MLPEAQAAEDRLVVRFLDTQAHAAEEDGVGEPNPLKRLADPASAKGFQRNDAVGKLGHNVPREQSTHVSVPRCGPVATTARLAQPER